MAHLSSNEDLSSNEKLSSNEDLSSNEKLSNNEDLSNNETQDNLKPLGVSEISFEAGALVGDKYEIVSLLGHGGMGAVYKVRQLLLNTEFALKLLDSTRVSDNVQLRRFQQEAKATSALNHQNLLRVHDFGLLTSDQPYFVMDYVQGVTLAEYIKKHGPLSIEQLEPIFAQVCAGLSAAHRSGVIHRDIKPNNIMLLENALSGAAGSIKVIDFGIAKIAKESGEALTMTRTGEVFGSPAYMSPEQCIGETVDNRTDIYSLGCVLFEALTGTPPFVADSYLRTMMLHQSGEIPTLKEAALGQEFPEAVESIVAKMLAKDRAKRYSDANQAASDYSRAVAGRTVDLGGKPVSVKDSRSFQLTESYLAMIIGGSALASALFTVALFAMTGQFSESSLFVQMTQRLFNSGKSVRSMPATALSAQLTPTSADAIKDERSDEKDGGRGQGQLTSASADREIAPISQAEKTMVANFVASHEGKSPSIKSLTVEKNNKRMRQITFPDFSFGKVAAIQQPGWCDKAIRETEARGVVTIPEGLRANLRIHLESDRALVLHDPAIYSAIAPDEFVGLQCIGAKQALYYDTSPVGLAQDKMLISLLRLCKSWKALRILQIESTVINELEVEAINDLSQLECFYVRQVQFDKGAFAHAPFLQRIDSFICQDVDFVVFEKMLTGSRKLKYVSVQNGVLQPSAFLSFRNCPELDEIRLNDKPLLSDQVFQNIASLPQVHRVALEGNFINTKRIKLLLASSSLQAIYLAPDIIKNLRAAGLTDERLVSSVHDPIVMKETHS